jgi:hypothetical protein
MLAASASVVGFNCTLFPPPAFYERRHRGLNLRSGDEPSQRSHEYRRGMLDDYRP